MSNLSPVHQPLHPRWPGPKVQSRRMACLTAPPSGGEAPSTSESIDDAYRKGQETGHGRIEAHSDDSCTALCFD